MDGDVLPVEELEPDEGWLCRCGAWMDHDLHCDDCGGEPPWGCPCDACGELDGDEWEDPWDDDFRP